MEKQNNVYFKLLDVNTDENMAIIRSEYDRGTYLVVYSNECRSWTISRYLNKDVVVNLGTDYFLDIFDKIILQDDDQMCNIRSREKTFYSSFDEMYADQAQEDIYPVVFNEPVVATPPPQEISNKNDTADFPSVELPETDYGAEADTDLSQNTTTFATSTNGEDKKTGLFSRIWNKILNLFK